MRSVIAESRRLASSLPPGAAREELLKLCDETEAYVNQLSDLCHKGMVGSAHFSVSLCVFSCPPGHALQSIRGSSTTTLCCLTIVKYFRNRSYVLCLSNNCANDTSFVNVQIYKCTCMSCMYTCGSCMHVLLYFHVYIMLYLYVVYVLLTYVSCCIRVTYSMCSCLLYMYTYPICPGDYPYATCIRVSVTHTSVSPAAHLSRLSLQGDTPHAKAVARALSDKLSELADTLSSATATKVGFPLAFSGLPIGILWASLCRNKSCSSNGCSKPCSACSPSNCMVLLDGIFYCRRQVSSSSIFFMS